MGTSRNTRRKTFTERPGVRGVRGKATWTRTPAHPDSVFAFAMANGGETDEYEPPHPAEPTDAPAGSWEKVEIMRLRVEQGQPVFSVDDRDDYDGVDQDQWELLYGFNSFTTSYPIEKRTVPRKIGGPKW